MDSLSNQENETNKRRPRLVKNPLQGRIFLIPSLVTVMGIFCGFLTILHAFQAQFEQATKLIALAFVLDGLDGRIARRLNATSAFGREFDSLSDIVAFGVAPAVLVYCWAFGTVADEFGMLVSFSLVVCGATRLARFNVDTVERVHFSGLPIPAAAAALASIVYFHPIPLTNWYVIALIAAYTIILAALMVSSIEFFSIKKLKLSKGTPKIILLLVSAFIALCWYNGRIMFLILTSGYILSGPLLSIFGNQKGNPDLGTTEDRKSG